MQTTCAHIGGRCITAPGLFVRRCSFSVRRHLSSFLSRMAVEKMTLSSSTMFAFYLGPKLAMHSISSSKRPLGFGHSGRVMLISFNAGLTGKSATSIAFGCSKRVSGSFYCLSVPPRILRTSGGGFLFGVSGRCYFRAGSCLLLAPRAC